MSKLVFTIMGFPSCGRRAALILIRYPGTPRKIRQADVNRNQATPFCEPGKDPLCGIQKNAVDFICENLGCPQFEELEFLYGQYQEEAQKKEAFKTSDDLDYYLA